MGEVPYQALPLLRFFAYKIRAREKVRKGEGEPGDEAICMVRPSSARRFIDSVRRARARPAACNLL